MFGTTRSISGCRLEEDNKAVRIKSKLVKAKYHPEAEEYPAWISEWSQGKEAPVTECERLPASLGGPLWISRLSWILESCSPVFCIEAFLYLLLFVQRDCRWGSGLGILEVVYLPLLLSIHTYLCAFCLPYLFDVSSLYCNTFHVSWALGCGCSLGKCMYPDFYQL